MKALKLLLVLVILGAVAYGVSQWTGKNDASTNVTKTEEGKDGKGIRLEEKYGVTGQGAMDFGGD